MASPADDPNVNRRALLATVGLVVPTLLVATACSREGDDKDEKEGGEEQEVAANEDLMREHGVLRRILIVYREAAPLVASSAKVDAAALNRAATLFRTFGEQYHEKLLEEGHVFPAVRKAGGDAARYPDLLVAQHERGRQLTDYIIDQTKGGSIATGQAEGLAKAMTGFSRMYEAHAAREDTIVFPSFKKALGKQYKELGEQFEEIERKQFGGDGFDMALDKVTNIEGALGLADLARFTAAPPPATA
ncbi:MULTISPECIES: hemerythrin domain-containing protein [Sphingomonas]|jgi:hemerythrin-like domain-containing protein|uniref:Hemerythrin-like domain-containing protein n=2 Tax=Sphingomonas TaxID=13687 RepID=A0A916WY00_9SPHN|nr:MULTISPECIES: hemerythrin domain-containing protein [Sphingomonas]PAX08932.1 hemerythrin HHE cation-binding protein [Sphingomonas lenta]GGB42586.1 hypothetical protein GCM10011380_35140 [Sphingomonas metalli]